MTDREDQGKNLLRMLTAAQPAPAPPRQPRNAWSNPEITPVTSSYPIPATDVRSAAAGEQHDRSGPKNFAGSPAYLSHYPAPTSATPGFSAGANLLRMIQQGAPQSTAETSTLQQRQPHQQQHLPQQGQQHHQPQYQQQQQQQQQHPAASPSPIPAQRSVAEEQERLLKRFLDINGSSSSSNSRNDTQLSSSAPPPPPPAPPAPPAPPYAAYPPAAGPPPPPPPPPLPPAVANESQGHKRQNSKSRGQERGKGRNQRGGRGRRSGGVGPDNGGAGYEPASPAQGGERKRAATPGRGSTGKQRGGGQNHGATVVRETRKGKKGGGRAPATSPSYAWSSFQNSPDPKSIPIPSLENLFLDGEASPRERAPGAAPPPLFLREGVEDSRWGGEDAEAAGLRTPPPLPERAARTVTESRSTAKKAEDDIKRMLWGDGWHLNDDS